MIKNIIIGIGIVTLATHIVDAKTIVITREITIVTQHSVSLDRHAKFLPSGDRQRVKSETERGVGTTRTFFGSSPISPSPAPVYAELPEFKKDVARKIKAAFPDNAREMIAIAMAESGLRCEAINGMDSNGVQAVGLFQINDGRWFSPEDIANLQNCDHNIERAKQKLSSQGMYAWGVVHTGSYKKYLWIFDEI